MTLSIMTRGFPETYCLPSTLTGWRQHFPPRSVVGLPDLVPKFAGSNPAEAVGFFGRKNPQHAFLRRGSKTVCPVTQLCGMSQNPAISWKSDCLVKFDRPFLAHTSSLR
jgi:hypothetical protein